MEPKLLEICPWCNQLLKAKAKPIKLKRITQIQVQVGEEKYNPITIASRAYGAVNCPNCGKEIYSFT
ncbi:hypothetical protein MUP77_17210 [Candidatus Bathyarchaeota archaeon]|nr:hypothetical protein [Candidatus Bathyarchaeota archaeon]